jgi:K+-transporting ATPase ATPase A chain
MTETGIFQVIIYLAIVIALVKPLGWYMMHVYQDAPCGLNCFLNPVEKCIYSFCGIAPKNEMNWVGYLTAMLLFNALGLLSVYGLQRMQVFLPLNPQHFSNVSPTLAFNTAASFTTNTDWQAYGGENSLSYLTQMLALTVQNFLSAATGMALLIAFIRGMVRHETSRLGNFWVDVTRGILYILLPLSLLFAIILAAQGVIQNFKPYQQIALLQPIQLNVSHKEITTQLIPMGPVASQIAIKQLGTNGGGYFNVNAAHPFENPNPLTNFLEMVALLLIPAAFCYTFGLMVKDKRQGWAILLAMLLIFIPFASGTIIAEQQGNPNFAKLGLALQPQINSYPGGNMEGKETRFGIVSSALWASATTASANGSVNAAHDSLMPVASLTTLWLMQLGEVIFGGVGSGLLSMLILVIITVFVAGLMVGRTPEYLGKKIEPYEMKMAAIAVLVMPFIVLLLTAIAVVTRLGTSALGNPGTHGFTEILYAFSSMGNNNGSAFAGLNANTAFYNIAGGIAMLIGRYWLVIPTLALAGSLAQKKIIPQSLGTLPTHTPLFIGLLISVTLIIGALTFFPALALGPIVEQLMLGKP